MKASEAAARLDALLAGDRGRASASVMTRTRGIQLLQRHYSDEQIKRLFLGKVVKIERHGSESYVRADAIGPLLVWASCNRNRLAPQF